MSSPSSLKSESPSGYLDELERLAALQDRGAISEQEFLEQKNRILGKLVATPNTAVVGEQTVAKEAPSILRLLLHPGESFKNGILQRTGFLIFC